MLYFVVVVVGGGGGGFYLLPRLLPTGGFLSCRAPGVPKPTAGGLDTPKVRPAEALMPGLLKLKPDVLLLPKPGERTESDRQTHTL